MYKRLILYPFFLSIHPILFFYAYNINEVSISDTIIPFLVVIALTALLYHLLKAVFKDKAKAGLISCCVLVWFFFYVHFFYLFNGLVINGLFIGRHRYLMVIWSVFFLLLAFLIIKSRRELIKLTGMLNILAICLLLLAGINIPLYKMRQSVLRENYQGSLGGNDIKREAAALEGPNIKPDVYYIILDAYARADSLKEFYNYDNSEFIDFLTKKGFFVAGRSAANYPLTPISLASSLNMEYLDHLGEITHKDSRDQKLFFKMIQDNKVASLLKTQGYKFVNIGSWWEPTRFNKHADYNFSNNIISMFSMQLLYGSSLGPFFIRENLAKSNLYCFDRLANVPGEIKGPKFVFAHILLPHDSILDQQGRVESLGETLDGGRLLNMEQNIKKYDRKYLNCLIFTNKKIKKTIEQIIEGSPQPPVIILQADHGPAPLLKKTDSSMSDGDLRSRMGILNAYYFPGVSKEWLYESISPVNSFRLLFNVYFKAGYELLEDRCYILKDIKYVFRFLDVTSRLKQPESRF